jgi:predicted metal-binding membrane protein
MIRALAVYRLYVIGRLWPLFLASVLGWLGLLLLDSSLDIPVLCTSGQDRLSDVVSRLDAIGSSNGWTVLLLSWLLMLAAMMAPLLAAPLMHVWDRSLAERRLRAALLFVFAYAAVWMLALCLLQAAALVLRVLAGHEILALAVAAGLALCWQRAGLRKRLLRDCHARRALPAFGLAAELGSLRFGVAVAVPCIGACGALMLVPLTSPAAHLPLMAAISIFMLMERFG